MNRGKLSRLPGPLLVLLLIATVALGAPPEVGEAVPDISLSSLAGEEYVLSERSAEGPVVLVFFRGAW